VITFCFLTEIDGWNRPRFMWLAASLVVGLFYFLLLILAHSMAVGIS
jgi:hypothetical protein